MFGMTWQLVPIALGIFVAGTFLAGLVSAWREIRAEKRETGTVTRPGWERPRVGPTATGSYLRGLFHRPKHRGERQPSAARALVAGLAAVHECPCLCPGTRDDCVCPL